MKSRKWIRAADFVEKYSLSIDHLHVHLHSHKQDRIKASKKEDGSLFVDENYFAQRREFRARVRNEIHSYFYMFEEHFSTLKVAKTISEIMGESTLNSVNHFLLSCFKEDESTILKYKVSAQAWLIYRAFRHLSMRTLRKAGMKIPEGKRIIDVVERILDNRMLKTERIRKRRIGIDEDIEKLIEIGFIDENSKYYKKEMTA